MEQRPPDDEQDFLSASTALILEGARAFKQTARLLKKILRLQRGQLAKRQPRHTRRDSGSAIDEWRTYRGFRTNMQRRQTEAERHNGPPITKKMLSETFKVGWGDSEKSISRQMVHYHLHPKANWPPSTWPENEPQLPDKTG